MKSPERRRASTAAGVYFFELLAGAGVRMSRLMDSGDASRMALGGVKVCSGCRLDGFVCFPSHPFLSFLSSHSDD